MAIEITQGKKTAIVFGATGLVGSHVLTELIASEIYSSIVIFVRRKQQEQHLKVEQHIIDFDNMDTFAMLIKGDDLFCCLGTTIKKAGSKAAFRKVDFEYVINIAKMAAQNKVNQFLLISSVGADPDALFFYSQVKGETEKALKSIKFWATHIFRPSLLLGERNENRWGEEIAKSFGIILDKVLGGLLSKYNPVHAQDVAKAMVKVAQGLQPGFFIHGNENIPQLSSGKWLDDSEIKQH